MYRDAVEKLATDASQREKLFSKNPIGYLISCLFGGIFIGFGVITYMIVAGRFPGSPALPLIQAFVFNIGLALIIVAGAELFTGNNLIMFFGALKKEYSWGRLLLLWLLCFLGNWAGGILLSLVYNASGLLSGSTLEAVNSAAQMKAGLAFWPMLWRNILCNMLVCLAVWGAKRLSSDSGRLIFAFWCVFTFVLSGFEHSVANMTTLSMALFQANSVLSLGSYFYVLAVSGFGNIIGGALFVALPYWIISREPSATA